MTCRFRRWLLATALAISSATIGLVASQPAQAQFYARDDRPVDFDFFYNQLAPYGNWFQTERWGYVWQPEDVGPDFRPYYDGHWVYTARYGWYWVSDEDWGDIVDHYGRWVFDPDDGWLWVPGYVWAPAWVIWREGDDVTGWFPMPPDDAFFDGDETVRSDWGDYADDDYGYDDWYGPGFAPMFFSLWTYVDNDHFGERHFHRYVHRDHDDREFYRRTHDDTHYETNHDYVVNRGIDPDRLPRPVRPVSLDDVLHHHAMRPAPIGLGRDMRQREWQRHPQLMPQWFQQNPAHGNIPGAGTIHHEEHWPGAADRGQGGPRWPQQHNDRFPKAGSPRETHPVDRFMHGHETAPPAAVQPQGTSVPNWGRHDWMDNTAPVPRQGQVTAPGTVRGGARYDAPDHQQPQNHGSPMTWRPFEHVQRPANPPYAAAPAQNFNHFEPRSFTPPAHVEAPGRSVPELASPRPPAENPQRRDEQPRHHGRRDQPQ